MALGLSRVGGDTPVNCLYEEVLGTWIFSESSRLGHQNITCSEVEKIVYTKEFTLEFPNIATDKLGFKGTWTIIYNQGFEVSQN